MNWLNGLLPTTAAMARPVSEALNKALARLGDTIAAGERLRNLHNITDFSGNYVSISSGVTVAGGGSVGSL